MKWNELKKIAEAKGWRFSRHGGNHDEYCHPNMKKPILIGRHGNKEIATGTFYNLKKIIGF